MRRPGFHTNLKAPEEWKKVLTFGGAPESRAADCEKYEKFFAFTMLGGTRPKVFVFEADSDGLESLSNVIRSEDVIAVVRGWEADFEEKSAVEVRVGGKRYNHYLPVRQRGHT